jgi:hypothetical protein
MDSQLCQEAVRGDLDSNWEDMMGLGLQGC